MLMELQHGMEDWHSFEKVCGVPELSMHNNKLHDNTALAYKPSLTSFEHSCTAIDLWTDAKL